MSTCRVSDYEAMPGDVHWNPPVLESLKIVANITGVLQTSADGDVDELVCHLIPVRDVFQSLIYHRDWSLFG